VAEWDKETIIARIRGEAQQQGVDPNLALAVATQESSLWPNATGDNGKSLGLFQLQPAAAIDVGVNPQFRHEPGVNIYGGVKYLGQKLQQSKGNVEEALRRYNGGGDPNYVQNVMRFFKPGVAEAAERPQTGTYTDADVQNALKALSGAPMPQEPSQGTYTDADVQNALKALGGTQAPAPVSQATPATQTPPGASQGPATPSPDVSSPEEAAAAIARLRAQQAPPEPGAITDPAALLAGGAAPGGAPQPVTDPLARLAGGQPGPSREQQIMDLARARQRRGEAQAVPLPPGVPTVEQETLEEGITKPSTMIPLLLPGAGARAGMRLVPEAWRWVGRVGGEAATQTAAELGGRAIETGQAPSFKDIATTTAWNLAPQAGEELLRAVPRTVLRSGQGARTILSDVAAQESKGLGRRVFHPEDEQVLSKMFEDVKASGVKLDIDPVTDLMASLTPTQRQVLLRDVKAISSPLATVLQRTGQPGAPRLTGWDIGDLQTLRSELIKRGHAVRTPERQDLINEMRMAVDEAIGNGMAVGSTAAGGNPEILKAAQAGWRRLKQSDDLQALVTKHTNYSPNLQYQDLNLAALKKSLDGTNPLGRKVAGSLGAAETKALQQELTTLAKRYPFVKVPNTIMNISARGGLPAAGYLAITGNLPGAAVAASSAVMAGALQSPKAMAIFRSAIVNGKGRLSTNDIAAIVNAVRQVSDVEEPVAPSAGPR